MQVLTLTHWKAKRAGARITIAAKLEGHPVKVVGVSAIEVTPHGVMATDKDGKSYRLAV